MLNKLQKLSNLCLLHSRISRWSSSSHESPKKIEINKQATWIKFKTNKKLACIDGFVYTHVPLPQFLEIDPIPYPRDTPWYNLNRFFHGGPFEHPPDTNPYFSGEQGYLPQHQPFDASFDTIVPFVFAIGIVLAVLFLREYGNFYVAMTPPQLIADAEVIQQMADERLTTKVNKLRALQAKHKAKTEKKKQIEQTQN